MKTRYFVKNREPNWSEAINGSTVANFVDPQKTETNQVLSSRLCSCLRPSPKEIKGVLKEDVPMCLLYFCGN